MAIIVVVDRETRKFLSNRYTYPYRYNLPRKKVYTGEKDEYFWADSLQDARVYRSKNGARQSVMIYNRNERRYFVPDYMDIVRVDVTVTKQ